MAFAPLPPSGSESEHAGHGEEAGYGTDAEAHPVDVAQHRRALPLLSIR
jgi:hypothetical protein